MSRVWDMGWVFRFGELWPWIWGYESPYQAKIGTSRGDLWLWIWWPENSTSLPPSLPELELLLEDSVGTNLYKERLPSRSWMHFNILQKPHGRSHSHLLKNSFRPTRYQSKTFDNKPFIKNVKQKCVKFILPSKSTVWLSQIVFHFGTEKFCISIYIL